MSERKWINRIVLGIGQNDGKVKLAILSALAAVFLFLIAPVAVKRTAALECSDCSVCHSVTPHGSGWQGCASCHGFPPATGSHITHFEDSDGVLNNYQAYGTTTIAQNYYPDPNTPAPSYIMGCGNCHPLDSAKHQNGTVEVELHNESAPADSLKAKNPSTASYTPGSDITTYTSGNYTLSYSNGTCSDVYCHSGYTVTSGPVGDPLTYPANPIPPGYMLNFGIYIMDDTCSNLTYAPYTVNYQRVYKTTPAWGTTGSFTTCTECHEFPLTTFSPDVYAMVGDSHQWVNEIGYNYGHAYNMGYFGSGVPCATCHNSTVNHRGGTPPTYPMTNDNIPTYWKVENGALIEAYYPVPLQNRALHINGKADVNFDKVNGYTYYYDDGIWYINNHYSLNSATYDPDTKTCSDVSCHYNPAGPVPNWQKKVRWGTPFRGWEGPGAECDVCHRNGYLNETCY